MSRAKMVAIGASKQVCLLSIVVLLAAGVCLGEPAVSLSPKSGPPTSKLLVSGSGYKPYAEIDIYFDTKDEAKVIADSSGKFSKISIAAPRSALPGKHWVSAVQRAGEIGAQAPFMVNTNWSQFGFRPDHVRENPYENVLTPSKVGSLGLLWNYTTGGAVQSSPAVADGAVYVGSNDGNVYALKTDSGAVLWSFSYGYPSNSAVASGVVYVNGLDALNASTGALLWNSGVASDGPPTLANGVIYLGSVDEDYAVNASDGSLAWKVHYGYATASSMAFANGVVYFGTTNSRLYELNASDGSDIICGGPWPGSGYSSPAVANGVVYFAGGSEVSAVDTITCTLLWSYSTGDTITSSPAVANGAVYIGSDDDNVYALNANTGAFLWSYTTGGAVTSSPAVANGVVYVGSDDNEVYALNASTGALLWSYTTGGAVESSPAIANGVVYVGSDDGNVYAFGLPSAGHTNPTATVSPSSGPPSENIPPSSSYVPSPVHNNGVSSIASFDQVAGSTSGGGISFAQVNDAIVHSTAASLTYGSAQTAGDLNVVVVGWNDAVSSVSSVTDTKGNIYSLAVGPTRGTSLSQSIYYAKNIVAAAAGANTVVVKFSQTPAGPDIRILEYSGLSTTSPLDVTAGAVGDSSSASSGSATTTAANELILGANTVATATAGPGSTFTSRIITASGDLAEDSIVSTTGSYSASASLSSSGNWVMQMATFKAASAGSIGFAQVNNVIDHPTSVSVAYGSAQTAGDLNVVVVGWNDAVSSVTSVTDTKDNIYSLAVGPTRGTGLSQSIYYAKNIVAAAAGANTVVVKFNESPGVPDIRILEYSGLSTTSPLDVTQGAFSDSSSASSGSATTTAANELIFGANTVATAAAGPGSTFTSRIITHSGDLAEDSIVSTTGSYSATAPLTSSGNWVMQMATFESGVITTSPPTVLSVSPSSGSDNGGTSVTITGTNFVSGAAATLGGTDASDVTVVSSTSITATTRAATAGTVTVLVTNPNGQSGSLNNGYTYTPNPTLTSVSPSSGSVSGGTPVTITGTNFASGATVTFGGTAATKVTFVSSTSITATTPAHAAGGVSVVVTNSNGLSGTLANGFVYNAIPSTIKFVQVAAATPQTPMSAVSVAYPSAQTAGNLNVMVVGWNDTSSSVQSVTDSHNNTYTLAVGPIRGTGLSQSIYYAKNIASGSNTVTATFNQAAAAVDLRVLEYSGANTLNPLDATASATGSSSTASSGSAPTNAANELVVAADMVYTANAGPGPGFTKRIITSPDGDLVEDEIVSTAGTYGATAPLTSSGPWVMQMATFKGSGGSGAVQWPIQDSTNDHYFMDQSTNPFLLIGDSPWSLPLGLDTTDQTTYVANRAGYGVNAMLFGWNGNFGSGLTEYGCTINNVCPFLNNLSGSACNGACTYATYDISTPNPAFYQVVANTITLVGQYGITALLDPNESGYENEGTDFLDTMVNNGTAKVYAYGQYLGTTFKSYPNIIWMIGNDFPYTDTTKSPTYNALENELVLGIKNTDSVHLITAGDNDPYPDGSLDDSLIATSDTYDAVYSYEPTYDQMLRSYDRTSPVSYKPAFLLEGNYWGGRNCTGGVTGTVNTNGTQVTFETGTNFANVLAAEVIAIAGTNYNILSVNSNTSITLSSSAGTQTGATFTVGTDGTTNTLRRQEYWTMTSGGTGYNTGDHNWIVGWSTGWQSNLNTPAMIQFGYFAQFFKQLPWYSLVPDYPSHSFVTAGYGTYQGVGVGDGTYKGNCTWTWTNNYASAALSSDKLTGVVYIPNSPSQATSTVTVYMPSFSTGSINAQWFDPTTNAYSVISGSPFTNSGTQNFTTPATAHSDGTHDWVLLLQAGQ